MKQRHTNNKKKGGKNKASAVAKNELSKEAKKFLEKAVECKMEGNAEFTSKKYTQAIVAYDKGLEILKEMMATTTEKSEAVTEATVQLYSNRSMVWIKLEKFAEAEADCNIILKDMHYYSSSKVWYRRAVAREQMALHSLRNTGSDHQNLNYYDVAETYVLQAKEDLQHCLEYAAGTSELPSLKITVSTVAVRLQKILKTIEQQTSSSSAHDEDDTTIIIANNGGNSSGTDQQHFNNNHHATTAPQTPQPIPVQQQRDDVVSLLQSRRNNNNGIDTTTTAAVGEAFFLLDWEWWCEWCAHVQFFGENNDNKQDLLRLLPAGAVLPDDVDDDVGSPGLIDNTALLLPHSKFASQAAFFKHWYQEYHSWSPTTTTDDDDCSSPHTMLALKPGLVRGHHYEVVPREVYNALRLWYSEVTPPICRRATVSDDGTLRLSLYLLYKPNFEFKENSGPCNACGTPGASMRCRRCLSANYCDRDCQQNDWKAHKAECNLIVGKNGMNGVAQRLQRSNGRTGLNNLGNTCFMNSALQALSHATPLTRHFLSGKFKADVNDSNPLGTGGKLAYAYEDVMKSLHNGSSRSCSPTTLKRAIAMFAPRFAGCLQHDAQEFLAYLLDGLHEDLNRIRKAPYVALPDVTDGQCIAVAGALAWDAHRRRNDSLVLDTFYGQFKSTCVCPKCNRVSVSFDAFNHVSLEIPQEKNAVVPIAVVVFPAAQGTEPAPRPIRYGVHIRRANRVSELKEALSALCDIPVIRLVLCEVYNHGICTMHENKKSLADVPMGGLVAYEVDPLEGPDSANIVHAIACHKLADPAPPPQGPRPPEPFAIPLMTSFPASLTCRGVWDHMWTLVGPMVSSDDGFDAKSILEIRLVTKDGEPKPVFQTTVNISEEPHEGDQETEQARTMSSLLPRDSDETLLSFVGPDAIKNFLFLDLEWIDPSEMEVPDVEGSKCVPRIDEEKFLSVANHSSWIEAEKKLRETSGTKGVTLNQCFETFTNPERLDEHNMWYCSSCKEHVRAMKTMELWKLPNVLIVHLKRFEFKHGLRRDKLDTLVDFPLEGLDLNLHCASLGNSTLVHDQVPAIYDCFAVINHFGRMGFGHYTAYARAWDETGISNDWALFDDSSVRSVGDGTRSVVSPAAYVLLYRRRTFH